MNFTFCFWITTIFYTLFYKSLEVRCAQFLVLTAEKIYFYDDICFREVAEIIHKIKELQLLYLLEIKHFLSLSLRSLACSQHLILVCIWVATFPSYLSESSWAVGGKTLCQEAILLEDISKVFLPAKSAGVHKNEAGSVLPLQTHNAPGHHQPGEKESWTCSRSLRHLASFFNLFSKAL